VIKVDTLGHVFVLVPCGDGCEEDDAETRAAKSVVRQEWLGTTATNTAAEYIDVPDKQRGG